MPPHYLRLLEIVNMPFVYCKNAEFAEKCYQKINENTEKYINK